MTKTNEFSSSRGQRPAAGVSLLLLGALASCRATQDGHSLSVVGADDPDRAAMMAFVSSLEGRWQVVDPEGQGAIEFKTTSNGSIVREVMFPGHAHEMTNVYALHGDALVMTHYCAGGNQPRMEAHAVAGDKLAFRFAGVSDLNSPQEAYMGEMELVRLAPDHVQEHWRAFKGGVLDHTRVIDLRRE